MGSVSGGGVRGSESDRWKRGLLGRVDNAFFCQSADDTGYTASVSYGPVCKKLCVQKLCAQREGLCTHMPCRSSCGLGRGFCEVCSAPCSGVILSAVIIRPPASLISVVDVLNLAFSFSELEELLGHLYPRSRRLLGRKCQSG